MSNRSQSHVSSQLLSDQENEFVFNVLGKGCFSLATCVAQLYVVQSTRKRHKKWVKKYCGAVCFVKDNRKKSYFIRIYDPKTQQMLWEQELYAKFTYNTPKEFFHTFEAHDCHVGLNFASEDEAVVFKKAIDEKLFEREKKRLEREKRRQAIEDSKIEATEQILKEEVPTEPVHVPPTENEQPKVVENTASDDTPKMRKKRKSKRKLTKEDVGIPADFRHISHMSWNANDGPHMDRLDSDMKGLLEQIGIKEKSQVDKETMDFIYDFVDKNGGVKAVKEDFASLEAQAMLSHVSEEREDQLMPVAPSHTADVAKVTPSTHQAAHRQPLSGVKVMDIVPNIRLQHPMVRPQPTASKPSHLTTRPPSPTSKPLHSNTRPPSPTSKPPHSNTRPPSPTSKPPHSNIRPPSPTSKPPHPISTSPFQTSKPSNTRPPSPTSKPPHSNTRPPSPTSKPPHSNTTPPSPNSQPSHPNTRPPPPTSKPLHPSARPPPPTSKPPYQLKPFFGKQNTAQSEAFTSSVHQIIKHQTVISSAHQGTVHPAAVPDLVPPQDNGRLLHSLPTTNQTSSKSLNTPVLPQSSPFSGPVIPKMQLDPQLSDNVPTSLSENTDLSKLSKASSSNVSPSDPTSNIPVSAPSVSNIPFTPSSAITAPPLPPTPPLAPPCPVVEHHTSSSNNSREGLLNEIHAFEGASLNHVTLEQETTGRAVLMKEIRTGTLLRHVDKSKDPSTQKRGSIAAALMTELNKRKSIIQFSDNEEISDEFDDDWDD